MVTKSNSTIEDTKLATALHEEATEDIDLVAEYLKLDPTGEFFTSNGIYWDSTLQEAAAQEVICGLSFARLLGKRNNVPQVDKYYVFLPQYVEAIRAAMHTGQNIMMTGPAGSGKSSIPQQLAARLNRPFFVADIHEDFRPDTLYGEYRPREDRTLVWHDGPLALALKNKGAFFLLDEMNFAG